MWMVNAGVLFGGTGAMLIEDRLIEESRSAAAAPDDPFVTPASLNEELSTGHIVQSKGDERGDVCVGCVG